MKTAQAPRLRPFDRSLPMQLMRAREAVMGRFRPHLHAHGLTDQQWRILRALVEVDDLEIFDLSDRCCIRPASLSRMLPRLEASGFIARRVNAADQRRIIVSMTARGRALFRRIAPGSEAIYAAIARDLGEERLRETYRVLGDLIERLRTRDGFPADEAAE